MDTFSILISGIINLNRTKIMELIQHIGILIVIILSISLGIFIEVIHNKRIGRLITINYIAILVISVIFFLFFEAFYFTIVKLIL